jgi:hypothetical protein
VAEKTLAAAVAKKLVQMNSDSCGEPHFMHEPNSIRSSVAATSVAWLSKAGNQTTLKSLPKISLLLMLSWVHVGKSKNLKPKYRIRHVLRAALLRLN